MNSDDEKFLTRKFRNVCFTLNNYTEEEFQALKSYDKNKYYCIGREVGKEKGTPHLQGYLEFKDQVRGKTLKKKFPRASFYERYENSTPEQASAYCKKDGNFEEGGKINDQGHRTDLEAIVNTINQTSNLREIAIAHPTTYIKYHSGVEKYRNLCHFTHRTEAPRAFWLYGKSGVGKTSYVINKHQNYYMKNSSQWWDGYEQQEAVLIDDYDIDHSITFREFLRLVQDAKHSVQVKGSMINFNSPYIYVTSEFHPDHYFGKSENTKKQISRRFEIIEMK